VEEPAGAATQRWRLLVAYDGAAFRGFAVQPEVPTVAGALRQALERTARLNEPPLLTCAGRTDAGVHARGQVVHVDLPPIPYDGAGLARAINRQLAPEIVVRRAEEVGREFDARRSATGRTYRYLVWTRAAWSIDAGPEALDADGVMPTDPGPDPGPGPGSEARLLRFEISASSFCHQMVRSLVAALVDVGRGKGNAAALLERLRAASRQSMPEPAPAAGLCLVSVDYSGKRIPTA